VRWRFIASKHNLSEENLQLRLISKAMLHGIYTIFPPPDVTGHTGATFVSIKQLKAKSKWEVVKDVVGWMIDVIDSTISLPEAKRSSHQCQRCHPSNSRKKWKLLSETPTSYIHWQLCLHLAWCWDLLYPLSTAMKCRIMRTKETEI